MNSAVYPASAAIEHVIQLNAPVPLVVRADADGTPQAVVTRGGRLAVEQVADRWCVEDDWWRQRLSRTYFALVLEDGRQLTVFRDDVTGQWYAQRYGVQDAPAA